MKQLRKQNNKLITGFTIEIILVAVCALLSVAYGSKSIPIADIFGYFGGKNMDSFQAAVIAARIPRTVFGILAGAALGVSGALMQAITRNPIADPSILGVNTGASLMVVIGIAYLNISSGIRLIGLSFAGALLTALFVYGIASVGYGGASSIKLALAGAAVSTALGALVNTIMLPDSNVMKAYRFWQVGSVGGATWDDVKLLIPFCVIGVLLALICSPGLNALLLGDEMAISLGVKVGPLRLLAAVAGVLLCAAVTALAGPIGFVGLMLPHVIRQIFCSDMRVIVPMSALGGAALLTISDVAGRVLGRPGELEVGIITALLGAPIFIWIVFKTKARSI
ncbi:iron complex transport system permease protein [Butyrivibrio fibrisolvens DSM 3071]|uniref:Iron complex transport system permease protein n=1 Tax=Butyrivibrio fibrisolvens DSM 3071 TaxID=1121131 RepID=A0A1M5Z2G4_BUTFI|nr:iron ABC transporter permease [Butyrivibrio fibrisolvens]SHI18462.1 iron complex transport system permease protein [Butyrivibrio fibrisolvens DSM 3071]